SIRGLARLAVEEGRGRRPLAPLLLSHQVAQAVVNPLPDSIDAPDVEVAVDGLPGRVLAGQGAPQATCAVDVTDGVHGQAQIGLTLPPAGFRGRDQAFEILPFSVGQVARVEFVAHPAMLPRPTGAFKTRSKFDFVQK